MVASPQKERGYTAIANEIMEALSKMRIAGEARQVLDFILRKTYGFNKKDDRISLSQFYLGTGLSKTHIIRAIHYLQGINIIFVTNKGNRNINIYRFNKDFTTWKPITKKGNVPNKGNDVPNKGNESFPIKGHTKVDITKVDSTKVDIGAQEQKNNLPKSQDYFYRKYEEVNNRKYVAKFGKDGKLFKGIRQAVNDEDKICSLIDAFFVSEDEFIINSGHTVEVFYSQINKLGRPQFTAVELGIKRRNPHLTDEQVKELAKHRKKEA